MLNYAVFDVVIELVYLLIKIAHWADEFSTDAFGEMLAIICKCRSSKKKNQILNK